MSVVDNVLLVHQVDAKVVILYDIYAESRAPISAPLPLLFRGFPRSNSSSLRSNREDNESSEVNVISDHEAIIYGDDWTFLVPDLIFSVTNKILWKIHLDLEASFLSFSAASFSSKMLFVCYMSIRKKRHKKLSFCINLSLSLCICLQAISASSSEVPSVLEFLQRRKLEANKVEIFICFSMIITLLDLFSINLFAGSFMITRPPFLTNTVTDVLLI